MEGVTRDVAQLVARVVRDDEVAGSSPVIPTLWRRRFPGNRLFLGPYQDDGSFSSPSCITRLWMAIEAW